jgi:hypothetical protein
MKTAIRIAAVLAVVAFATPVLACSDTKTTAASADKVEAGKGSKQVASAEKTSDKGTTKAATVSR